MRHTVLLKIEGYLKNPLDNVGDRGMRVGAPAARFHGVRPGAAQRGGLLAQPGVAQQHARTRALLRVLLEALQEEALHVAAHILWQRRVLVLQSMADQAPAGRRPV